MNRFEFVINGPHTAPLTSPGGENNDPPSAPVPEPASLLLLGTGLGFAARRLRSQRSR